MKYICFAVNTKLPRRNGTVGHVVPVVPWGEHCACGASHLLAPGTIKNYHCDIVVGFGRLLSQDVLRSGGGTHRGFLLRMGQQRGGARKLWQSLSPYHQSLLQIEKRQYSDRRLQRIIAVSDEVRRDIEANYQIPTKKLPFFTTASISSGSIPRDARNGRCPAGAMECS